jgi:Secretion system C-terminal sorting domain
MKKSTIFIARSLLFIVLSLPVVADGQSTKRDIVELETITTLSPDVSTEICPNTDIQFTFTVEGNYTLPGSAIVVDPVFYTTIVQQPILSPITYNPSANKTTCKFKVRFRDISLMQAFRVKFKIEGQPIYSFADYYFTKVKSFFQQTPMPDITTFTTDPCEVKQVTISFPRLQYITQDQPSQPPFGSVTEYEYSIPEGWLFNGTVAASAATAFIASNTATITSNSGGSGEIRVRGINRCAPGIAPGPWRIIPVVRRKPALAFTGPDQFCSNAQYSFAVTPPWVSSYTWAINPPGLANITQGNPATFTGLSGGTGTISLTLNSANCGTFLYETQEIVGKNTVTVGSPRPTDGVFWFYPAPFASTNLKPFNVFEIYHPYNIATVIEATFSGPATSGWSGYWTLDNPVPNVYFWTSLSNNRLFVKYDPLLAIPCYDFSATFHGTSSCGSLQNYTYRFSPSYTFSLRYVITPNPASDLITISRSDRKPINIRKIIVTDVQGNVKLSKEFSSITNNQIKINISELKPATYFLRIFEGQQLTTQQLIVQ